MHTCSKMEETKTKATSLFEEIEMPEGVTADFTESILTIKKGQDEIQRRINPMIEVKVEGNKITLIVRRVRKTEKKMFGTTKAHVRNMVKGFDEPFKYKLHIANVHFPMTVTHDKDNNQLFVKNFLGEKTDRKIKLVPGVNIKLGKEEIDLEYFDREKAGQCAANIEKGTRVRNKDRRIFQDGIFIIEKPNRKFM